MSGDKEMKFMVCEPNEDFGNGKKICITGHSDDIIMFGTIMNDILDCRDCNIYVSTKYRCDETRDERRAILGEMDLLVCVVSGKFLANPDCLGRKDMYCAQQNNIPILPIMVEPGLETPFNHICGDIHLLNRGTEKYIDALRERINEIVLDANAKLIAGTRLSFSGEIFLSYRKRNYGFASKLICELHQIESFQDVSIWYDDFLGLGEDYSDEIAERIKHCNIFLLMVTPDLLEDSNYVMKNEYPLARELGKKIVAIEVVPTDLVALRENSKACQIQLNYMN